MPQQAAVDDLVRAILIDDACDYMNVVELRMEINRILHSVVHAQVREHAQDCRCASGHAKP